MKHPHRVGLSALAVVSGLFGAISSANGDTKPVGVDPDTGLASAVVVEDKALAHTAQLLPLDTNGKVVGDTLEAQLESVTKNLADVLESVGSGLPRIARLNVYVTGDALVPQVRARLAAHLGSASHPATTFIVSALLEPQAVIALDAIATVRDDRAPDAVTPVTCPGVYSRPGQAHVAVLPKGRTLYISGMAESSDDLEAATVGTMAQLNTVLALNGIGHEEVVHLKAYMKPATMAKATEQVMARDYTATLAPPMTLVEWNNGLPIEIELIAHLPATSEITDPVQLLWQPEEKRSPVYCRFAVVNSKTRIYTEGFLAKESLDADGQIRSIYKQLEATITPLGSDFRHLVKATYYHSAEDTSASLNAIRPELYDPERPPAASKASIAGTGDPSRTMVIDMIAVPR